MASGRNIKLILAKEPGYGTSPTTGDVAIKLTDITPKLDITPKKSDSKVGSRFSPDAYIVSRLGDFSLKGEVYPDTFGYVLKGFYGSESSTTSGTGGKHTFTPIDGETLPSWTGQVDNASVKTIDHIGIVFDTLDLELKIKEFFNFSIGAIYQDEDDSPPNTYSKSFSTLRPFVPSDMVIKIDGSTVGFIKSMKVSQKNNCSKDGYYLNATDKISEVPAGEFQLTGEMEVKFDAAAYAERTKWLNGTAAMIEITCQSTETYDTGKYYTYYKKINKVKYSGAPINPDNTLMTMTLSFEAYESSGEITTDELYNAKTTDH